jgi:enamine deaminase RidA (YjgF/YER057c/UK114 family)
MRKGPGKIIVLSFACAMIAGMSAARPGKTTKQFLNLDGKQPPGYTHVVTSAPGKMIFISGRGGIAHDGKMPAESRTQAKNTFEDLKRRLALAGASSKIL